MLADDLADIAERMFGEDFEDAARYCRVMALPAWGVSTTGEWKTTSAASSESTPVTSLWATSRCHASIGLVVIRHSHVDQTGLDDELT